MDKITLEALVEKGGSTRSIAKEAGISQSHVRKWLAIWGLRTKHKPRLKVDWECSCGETDRTKFYGHKGFVCKECYQKDARDRKKLVKKEFVEYKGGKCCQCGYDKCLSALCFHHINPLEKDPDWLKLKRKSSEDIKLELDKCILLCANCHAEIHTK